MLPQQLDRAFPFVVFVYGAVMTFVLHIPALMQLAEEKLSDALLVQFRSHKATGLVCFLVGGLWSLQRVIFS